MSMRQPLGPVVEWRYSLLLLIKLHLGTFASVDKAISWHLCYFDVTLYIEYYIPYVGGADPVCVHV